MSLPSIESLQDAATGQERNRTTTPAQSSPKIRAQKTNGKAYLVLQETTNSFGKPVKEEFGVFVTVEDANNSLRAQANTWTIVAEWEVDKEEDGCLLLDAKGSNGKAIHLRVVCYTIKAAGSVPVTKLKKTRVLARGG